jgi:membrane-bound lytic murein transglycosylase F
VTANQKHTARRVGLFPIIALGVVITGIGMAFFSSMSPTLLDSIHADNTLKIVTRNGPTTYFKDQQEERGFEYELAGMFAQKLGVAIEVITVDNLKSLLTTTKLGGVHIAAAGIAATDERKKFLAFSEPYYALDAVIVYRAGEAKPREPKDLLNKSIVVIANSSHAEMLNQLKPQYPTLTWDELPRLESIDFLEMVRDFHYDFAVIDSNEFAVNRELFPSLSTGMTLGEPQMLAWGVMKGSVSKSTLSQINEFLAEVKADGRLDKLIAEYFAPSNDMSRGSAQTFTKRVENILPNYRTTIQNVASKHELPWTLLAAMAYQESHWDPKATSPTGVRGMMMLTQTTAKEMGVTDRLDAEQSLHGGAEYFQKIHQRLPERITEPDRTNLALAAYNIGLGHLEDARVITQRQGKNPDLWQDVKEHLPLLQKRRWYSKTKFGYARGQEPVDYVSQIRRYESYLEWHELSEQNRQLTAKDDDKSLEEKDLPLPIDSGIDAL